MRGEEPAVRAFTVHEGTAVPLRRGDVDTDQIIPGEFCKRVGRTGYADALFAGWRGDPDYVLARPEYQGATVLVAGARFGIGSSREHAVWALLDHGFRAVLAPSFGDIFRGNAHGNGLLTVRLPADAVEELWHLIEQCPDTRCTVDLTRLQVAAGELRLSFDLEEHSRRRLLKGLDDIAATMEHGELIDAFERRRAAWKPVTLPVPGT